MNILVIPDKFKGSLTSKQVIKSISKGIIQCDRSHHIVAVIASDGGDGFLEAVLQVHPKFENVNVNTVNPFGKNMVANYVYDPVDQTAYIELAKASGLALLKESEPNCKLTSTYGTGVQIKHAIQKGAKNIYIGLGGSATNDGGTGILRALGFQFMDKKNNTIETNGGNLQEISNISPPGSGLENVHFYTVNDVSNLLLGKSGATYTYALQKGAKENDIPWLEKGMENLFHQSKKIIPNLKDLPGFGAAGGTCFGLHTFLNATIISGTDFLFKLNNLDNILSNNDIELIITGEGKIDKQTLDGKFIHGICSKAKTYPIPVIVICGVSNLDKTSEKELGVENIYPIKTDRISVKESMENAASLIEQKAYEILCKTKPLI